MPEITALDRIRELGAWYGKKARRNRSIYVAFKIVQIVMAASIPVISVAVAGEVQRWTVAILGALIGVIEAVLQLGQFQQNWLTYRATREALRREDFLHSAKAGPYSGGTNTDVIYVERADAIISGESAKWIASQEQQVKVTKL
jgi:hypothetical protein